MINYGNLFLNAPFGLKRLHFPIHFFLSPSAIFSMA